MMSDLAGAIQHGTFSWIFIPGALILGALHGLEPGHSKTMMAAFIIAIRGTITQAIMLSVAATVSHTAMVWIVALLGMIYGQRWLTESTEPYFALASAAMIVGIATWRLFQTYVAGARRRRSLDYHSHSGSHDHSHGNHCDGHVHDHAHSQGRTLALAGAGQTHHGHLTLASAMGEQRHAETAAPQAVPSDEHAQTHARDILKRTAGGQTTNSQIILFGLTGGLVPCPAAIMVRLVSSIASVDFGRLDRS